MPTLRSLVGAAALTVLGVTSASAALVTYYRAGFWHAFSGRDEAGRLVCGMDTSNPTDASRITITAVIGTEGLFFRITKPTWKIPKRTSVALFMRVGNDDAVAYEATGEATHLDWSLGTGQIRPFHSRFRNASTMTLSFPEGNEPSWRISLAGSNAVDHTFAVCVRDLSERTPQSTESPVPAGPTQPFGQQPTQPMIITRPLAPPPGTGPDPMTPDSGTAAPVSRSP